MPASWPLFAVLGSAFVYTIAALCTKRALSGGATVWQVNFAANMAMAVLYLPFWLGVDFPRLLAQGYKPIGAAITFSIGQLFTFAALRKGDVSVATPLLGAKVIFVALLTSVLFGEAVGIKWWLAALICTVGIFLVTGSQRRTEGWTRHSGKTAAYSLIAAVACSAESGGYPRDPVFRRRDGGQYRLQFTVRPKRRDGLATARWLGSREATLPRNTLLLRLAGSLLLAAAILMVLL
ncbi:MAG: DMT family transporter [Terrimicrobiaceae bacterium]